MRVHRLTLLLATLIVVAAGSTAGVALGSRSGTSVDCSGGEPIE